MLENEKSNEQHNPEFLVGAVSGCRFHDKTSGRSYKTHNKQNGREPKFRTSN